MGFLTYYSETERLEFHENYYAKVRVYLSSEASEEAKRRMLKVAVRQGVNSTEQEIETDFDQGAFKLEIAAQAVIEWNLTDENDVLLPHGTIEERRASVRRLPGAIVDEIFSKVKEEIKRDPVEFPDGAASGTPEGECGTP